MSVISINTESLDADGRIRNRYNGEHDGDNWVAIPEAEWPEADAGDDEIPRYYYDENSGDVWVEYETIEHDVGE